MAGLQSEGPQQQTAEEYLHHIRRAVVVEIDVPAARKAHHALRLVREAEEPLAEGDRHDTVLHREALNAGATAYLVRPLRPTEFLRYVAEALVGRERRIWRRTPLAEDVIISIGATVSSGTGSPRLAAMWPAQAPAALTRTGAV